MEAEPLADEAPYDDVYERIATLAEQLVDHEDPDVASGVAELLDWVDAFHRDGVGRLIDMIREWRGEIFLEAAARDAIVGSLFAAYGLGEARDLRAEAEADVARALDEVRPLVESHGGSVDAESVVDGVVTVRLSGTCDGCPSADATLVYGVEAALREQYPHYRRLELAEPLPQPDPAKADLECVTVPEEKSWQRVELRPRS
ncbi:MAG: NifU family protein [Acidimicrobiales bacterium]|nr:NifU family protein [Acidimicrobiales bacterium]